ncbi:MAG: TRAP transporter TatT component family protein [Proteobacteria bacterium]|nr:TRAP transporter TatT component family protein [Pseudomonadota bacterium]MBU1582473.1 TRAP transporter TatT component family protein [Pseudomonadota bacterium]MBU2454894.1 TRAP transporter TatT component family protein [Pseudomonadota bacterium]MBU2627596.1 TRAP transporter TatT component family protein [Pseudomonadota bacterium]
MLNHAVKPSLLSAVIFAFCLFSLFLTQGCSIILSSATSGMMEHLSKTILNNDDLSLVESGAPAYLLMIDSLISKDPDDEETLSTAAMLYSAYADLFVKEVERSRKMADKALNYANRALCLANGKACRLKSKSFEDFEKIIFKMEKRHVPALFALGNAWAGWIMANKNDFNAIADMSHIELIMQRVIELDETYKDGAAYLYLGTLATLLPPALGGKPELGKRFFETAARLSQGKNLMVNVIYAKMYARMIFDRRLHDQLLNEVLAADPYVPDHTLINTYAQKQAKELMDGADDYF